VRACVQAAMARGDKNVHAAIVHCREKVGRPIVGACMGEHGKGAQLEACRARASPSVRACVRRSMIATVGRARFRQTVEHCRQTVGRPIVRACMGGNRGASLHACRAQAFPKVRACVRRMLRAA
jgi:hypothetical protein